MTARLPRLIPRRDRLRDYTPPAERPPSAPEKPDGKWPAYLPPNPTADRLLMQVKAQSLLTRGGVRAELPSYEEAMDILGRSS